MLFMVTVLSYLPGLTNWQLEDFSKLMAFQIIRIDKGMFGDVLKRCLNIISSRRKLSFLNKLWKRKGKVLDFEVIVSN